MQKIKIVIFVCLLSFSNAVTAQEDHKNMSSFSADTARVNALIKLHKETVIQDKEKAIAYAVQAQALAKKIKYQQGEAEALKRIGIAYYYSGNKFYEALDYWEQAIKVYEDLKDDIGISNMLNNIGALYFNQGQDIKALEFYLRSLKVAEASKDKFRRATALNNLGGVYFNKKATYDKALDYFSQALPLAEESGDVEAIITTAANLGEVYAAMENDSLALQHYNKALKISGESESMPYLYNLLGKFYSKRKIYNSALKYHKDAYDFSKKIDSKLDLVQSLIGIGSTYEEIADYKAALSSYKEGEKIAIEIEARKELEPVYLGIASSYAHLNDFAKAYEYKSKYATVKEELYDIETDNKIAVKQYDFDIQKKEGQINLLTKEKSLTDLEIKRQRLARTALTIGLALVFLIAFILFRNYRAKAKTNLILDKQKNQIEGLLLNILPSEVAKELQDKGAATPRSYERVSVLFSDFKGFTAIADKMTPEDLVAELNTCFMVFDKITEKYGLEKIKTIGDAYMCAGGIPVPKENHVYDMIKASIEMQDYIISYNKKREEMGLEVWDLRIGIHVGPVVAGVVGKKKYAYDIWGSTVNIASRMESNGAPGRVNISAATYEVIKDKYVCSPRGKIYAKNVGEIDMYFVDYEIDEKNKLPISIASEKIVAG